MSTSTTLKLALELAAKVTGREDLAALAGEVPRMFDYAYRLIEPTSYGANVQDRYPMYGVVFPLSEASWIQSWFLNSDNHPS